MSLTDPLALIKKTLQRQDDIHYQQSLCFPFHHIKIVCRKHLAHFEKLNSKPEKGFVGVFWGGKRAKEGQSSANAKNMHYLAYKFLRCYVWTCTKFGQLWCSLQLCQTLSIIKCLGTGTHKVKPTGKKGLVQLPIFAQERFRTKKKWRINYLLWNEVGTVQTHCRWAIRDTFF